MTIAKLVENVKVETSQWAKIATDGTSDFQWQSGYGVFSVSHSLADVVDKYIREQIEHQKRFSFKKNIYRRFCAKHGIDERYVWDYVWD